MIFMVIIFYFSQTYTVKIKLKKFNSFHALVKQTFNQPLLIYNICCALYALMNSLFLIYRNKVFYYKKSSCKFI